MPVTKKPATQKAELSGNVYRFGRVRKSAATEVATRNPLNTEDAFRGLYGTTVGGSAFLEPPYNPELLEKLCEQNNILAQCVEAMEVNIDGTGTEAIKLQTDGDEDENEKKLLEEFIDMAFPGMSLTTIRRKFRKDLERVGYGFLEVLRTVDGNIAFLRHMPAATMRLMTLDAPIQVTRKAMRGGKEVEFTIWASERRFVQRVGASVRYYKEFGATRQIDGDTGEWGSAEHPITDLSKLGTELIYVTVNTVSTSPYGLPRWINQLPSVLGSRRAEEYNLEFFDAGGIPPAIVFVSGGQLASDVRQQLNSIMAGGAKKNQYRGAVVEITANTGSLDEVGKVDVKVEKFGDTNAKDAMFVNYDKSCWDHVREAFRLPGIFLGRSGDYNFATAMTAMMLADGQVFEPERFLFDELMNTTIVPGLGVTKYKLHSLPLTVKDAQTQLKALEMVKDIVSDEKVVETVNSVANLSLEVDADKVLARDEMRKLAQIGATAAAAQAGTGKEAPPSGGTNNNSLPKPDNQGQEAKTTTQKNDYVDLVKLARRWAEAYGIITCSWEPTDEDRARVNTDVFALTDLQRSRLDTIIGAAYFAGGNVDPEGMAAIAHLSVDQMCGCGDGH